MARRITAWRTSTSLVFNDIDRYLCPWVGRVNTPVQVLLPDLSVIGVDAAPDHALGLGLLVGMELGLHAVEDDGFIQIGPAAGVVYLDGD